MKRRIGPSESVEIDFAGGMSTFIGGSAYNMVRDIADGFVIVSERTFKPYGKRELADFAFEAERLLREVRVEQPAQADVEAIRKRQRRIQRLQQAVAIAHGVGARRQ